MATTNSTGLVQNTDFSAELMLNKIMNKQYRAQNGNTLTLAGRINAAKLDAESQSFGVDAENMAKQLTFVNGTENLLGELKSLLQTAIENSKSADDSASRQALGAELNNQLTALLKTKVNGTDITASDRTVELGLGSGTIGLGLSGTTGAGISELNQAISTLTAGSEVAQTVFDAALSKLVTAIAVQGEKARLIENRYAALNDLAATYADATNDQVVTEGGNPTSLLNTLL